MELKDLGANIDALYNLRQMRLELQRQVDDFRAQETAMRGQILECLGAAGLAKASGLTATVGVKTSIEPLVQDWDSVFAYIRRENQFALIQKRISAPAWRELKEVGIIVPGTEPNEVIDLSLTKSTRG